MSTTTRIWCCLRRDVNWAHDAQPPRYLDPKTDEIMRQYHADYARMFGVSFADMRRAMKDVCLTHSVLPFLAFDDIVALGDDEWVIFTDDDDLILPEAAAIIQEKKNVFDDVGLIAWPVLTVPCSGHGRWFVQQPSRMSGCPSNGYAIKATVFKATQDGRQRRLLRDDHLSVHSFVWFLGYRFVFAPQVGAVRILHAASITAAREKALQNYKLSEDVERMISELAKESVCNDKVHSFVADMLGAIYRQLQQGRGPDRLDSQRSDAG